MEGFGIFGVVKETGVDDEGLVEFSTKYFGSQYPLYCDKSRAFYQALGDRKVGLSALFNPFSLIGLICDAYTRLTSKSISGNVTKGEGVVQGGIIVFDKNGKPACMYEEETGVDLRVADIVAALKAVRLQQQQQQQQQPGQK